MSKLSTEQIADLKKQHGAIVLIVVGAKECYFKEPSFTDVDAYYASIDNDHITDSWKMLVELLHVGGDFPVSVSEFAQVHAKLKELLSGEAVATLKKL